MDDLEQHTQYDRWQLARDFRAITGTSPYRYLIYQRLNRASQDLLKGRKVAETALAFGFTDQSHFHRQDPPFGACARSRQRYARDAAPS